MAILSNPLVRVSLVALPLVIGALLYWSRPAPAPVRIGVLHSLTGPMAVSEQPLVDAVRLAVEEINARGGVLDRPLAMVVADGRSDPSVFAREAERLIDQQQVSALFACWTSSCRKAVKAVVERRNHLLFYPVQYEGLETSANVVYTGSTLNQQIIPGVRWAMATLGRRVYLAGSDYLFPRVAHRIIRDLVELSGGEILGERLLPLDATDAAPVIGEIRRLRPDVVFNTLNGQGNDPFFRGLREAGLEAQPLLSFSVAEEEMVRLGGDALVAHYAVWSYFQSLETEENRRFVHAFQERFGPERVTSDPIQSAYVGVHLWALAVGEAGSVDPRKVNRTLARQTLPAPSGTLAVDAATRHLWKPARIGRVRQGGQFEILHTFPDTLRPIPFPEYRPHRQWLVLIQEWEHGP